MTTDGFRVIEGRYGEEDTFFLDENLDLVLDLGRTYQRVEGFKKSAESLTKELYIV